MKKEPAYKSCHGRIRASVWVNYRHNTPATYRVSISRFSTRSHSFNALHSFGYDDVMSVASALVDCHNWIDYQIQANALRSSQ